LGRRGADPFLPHTLGHEGAGTVIAAGPAVSKVREGQRVVLSWIKGSGANVPGTRYESAGGWVNSGAVSTFMRHAVVSENRLTVIPPEMPLREAALLGCAIPTGAGIVWNTARLQSGQSIAVIGAGGIGLSAVLGAVIAGARLIIAVDVVASKLVTARELGAHHTIDASREDPVAVIQSLTEGKGVDVAVEAAGKRQTMEMAFEIVRTGGGQCVLAGNLALQEKISIDPFALIAGKRLMGTWGGEARPDEDIPRYVELYREGKLPLGRLISREYSLEQTNDAMEALRAGEVVRALIRTNASAA
jgi:S-(hydroxymethyl)glutathione dehydrogenase/alcohol dehydrogenase